MMTLIRQTAVAAGLAAAILVVAGAATGAATGAVVDPPSPIWASVSSDGKVLGASGVTGVNKFGNGRYNLTTDGDITGASIIGTINSTGGKDPGPGSASILVGAVDAHTLFVRTATPSGSSPATVDDSRPFSVAVFLPPAHS
jgi:hypothetical protein